MNRLTELQIPAAASSLVQAVRAASRPRVAIGYADNGTNRGEFTDAILGLQDYEFRDPSPDYEFVLPFRVPGTYVPINRNTVVKRARKLGVDWLLQLDVDEWFPPDFLRRLIKLADPVERPVVTGVYSNIGNMDVADGSVTVVDCLYREVANGAYETISPTQITPFTVDACGSGILLTHMSVFDKMEYPWFWLYHIQVTGVAEPQPMNEDIAFCRKLRELGIDIWCDPQCEVVHMKTLPLVSSQMRQFLTAALDAKKSMIATLNQNGKRHRRTRAKAKKR